MKELVAGGPFPQTDEEAKEYLPESAHSLYRIKRKGGKTIEDALRETLEVVENARKQAKEQA